MSKKKKNKELPKMRENFVRSVLRILLRRKEFHRTIGDSSDSWRIRIVTLRGCTKLRAEEGGGKKRTEDEDEDEEEKKKNKRI